MYFEASVWAGGVAPVDDHLPSKCEALSSNPSTEKKLKRYYKYPWYKLCVSKHICLPQKDMVWFSTFSSYVLFRVIRNW
jgi:hypothetical protein